LKRKPLIALPVFNEENNLAEVLSATCVFNYDVLLVDDGSTDASVRCAERYNVNVLKHEKNKGLSEVYKTFVDYALENDYTHIITFDTDGQHNPEFIPKFDSLLANNDLVIGNRFSSPEKIPEAKLSSNLFASLLVENTTGFFLPDVSCGFRGFSLDFIKSFEITSDGFGVIFQMIFEMLKQQKKYSLVKIPANYENQKMETKSLEILGLLRQASKYSSSNNLDEYLKLVKTDRAFSMKLMGFLFNFMPVYDNAYVISTDIVRASEYYDLNANYDATKN